MITANDLNNLYNTQLPQWQLAHDNYAALNNIEVKTIVVDGIEVRIQHNPARITSVSSSPQKTPQQSCFLCSRNLPVEQLRLQYNNQFTILVNPYPIFNHHFTIPANQHTPQRIAHNIDTMLQLAHSCSPYTIFYNGPRCGASAPMHLHFQVADPAYMPIEQQWKNATKTLIYQQQEASISLINGLLRHAFIITATHRHDAKALFDKLYNAMPPIIDEEPMMNIVMRYEEEKWIILIFPRAKHRPDCYYNTDDTGLLISPGSVEMGGVFITPRKEDFSKITPQNIIDIYNEVSPSVETINNIISKIKL